MDTLRKLRVEPLEVIVDPALDGVTNMLRDVRLLEHAELGIAGARVYSWDGPWISLGKGQVAERDLLQPTLVPWVHRPTGGKAVLHGHDVTVGMAFPLDFLLPWPEAGPHPLSRSVKRAYRLAIAPLVDALNDAGRDVCLAEDLGMGREGARSEDCFAGVSPNDIVFRKTGLKACGCALRLTSYAVIVQASIPNGKPLVDPSILFGHANTVALPEWEAAGFAQRLAKSVGSRVKQDA
jgi:lipoate-protein ligase A